jgi:hypothetical protein
MGLLTLIGQSVAMFTASMVVGMLPLFCKGRMSGTLLSKDGRVFIRRLGIRRGESEVFSALLCVCSPPPFTSTPCLPASQADFRRR